MWFGDKLAKPATLFGCRVLCNIEYTVHCTLYNVMYRAVYSKSLSTIYTIVGVEWRLLFKEHIAKIAKLRNTFSLNWPLGEFSQ